MLTGDGHLVRKTHPEKLQDGQGIDHLSEEFFATVDPLIEEGYGICFG